MLGGSVEVLELLAERERIEAQLLQKFGAFAASGEWAADGVHNPTRWLIHHGRLSPLDAARLVRNARLVHHHDRTAKLLDSGDITSAHVDVIARAARHREECFDEHEDTLLDAASTLPVEGFRTVARRWRVLADDVLADRDATHAFARRRLHCSVTFRGTVRIDGELDPHGGALVLAALDAHSERDGTRPAAQRRADALVRLAAGEHATVTIDVLVDADTLTGEFPGDLTTARCDLPRVGPVAPNTIRRLACDALLGRILRSGSEILDVGRRQRRLATPAQRRAVLARDGGCIIPGCGAPPEWCDIHHHDPWHHGGETNLDNLYALCRPDHVAVHEGKWKLQRKPDGTIQAIPP